MYSHSSTCAGTSRGREFLTDCIELRVSQFAIKLLQSYLNIRKQIRTSRRLELLQQIYIWQSQKEISNKFDIFYFHKLKEMPNIRDYMNTHNITSSSRDSQEIRRPVNADYVNQRNITERYRDPITDNIGIIPPKYTNSDHLERIPLGSTTKYQKSKTQCIQQLTRILEDIDRSDLAMKRLVEEHNSGVLKKFSADYDNYAQQILRTVELHLKENKQRLLSQIKQRRGMEAAECKPIKRNMQKLKNEITSLREGLYRENEYRQYISKIVLRDYQHDLVQIQQDIKRLSLARVDLSIDEKYNSCFKNDLNKIIVVRDQLQSRIQEQYTYSPNYSKVEETPINSHLNRDQIKRVSSTQAPRNPV